MTSDEAFEKKWADCSQSTSPEWTRVKWAGMKMWKAALEWAATQQEPIAYYTCKGNWPRVALAMDGNFHGYEKALYEHPAPAQPVRLSDEDIATAWEVAHGKTILDEHYDPEKFDFNFANAIQDALFAKGAAQPDQTQKLFGVLQRRTPDPLHRMNFDELLEELGEMLDEKEAQPAVVQLDQIEQYRLQMAAIGTACFGYWKEGDSIKPEYDTAVLRDVAKLFAKYEKKSAVVQQLETIALIAHHGGLVSLSESDALTLIRKLTINHHDWKMSVKEAKAALAAYKEQTK